MKMTVKEAFEKYESISIDYIFITKCRNCGKYFSELDEEYSFEGNTKDYTEWLKHYDVISLDDEIEQNENDNTKFALYRNDSSNGLCKNCEDNE